MLCRAEAVREVGLLDEGYWLYMEDLDWCHRFWDAGWKVFYEPAGGRPPRQGRLQRRRAGAPRQEIAFHRGMARFYRRFDAPEHNPLLNAAVYAGIGAKLAVALTRTAISRPTRPIASHRRRLAHRPAVGRSAMTMSWRVRPPGRWPRRRGGSARGRSSPASASSGADVVAGKATAASGWPGRWSARPRSGGGSRAAPGPAAISASASGVSRKKVSRQLPPGFSTRAVSAR